MTASLTLTLKPQAVTLAQLERIYRYDGAVAKLDSSCYEAMAASAATIARAAQGDAPVYGVNTGFGKLANTRIAAEDTASLQRNLILSHCCGVGEELPPAIVRLIMALKLISLGRGVSGVTPQLIRTLERMIERGVVPRIPARGSVGASGDLAPLAHMAAVMIGEGEAYFDGRLMNGGECLRAAGIEPLVLGAKEGLALINGTQVSTALALVALFDSWHLLKVSLITGALATDAMMGSAAPFRPEVHAVRGHKGQIDAATSLRALMQGSEIRESHYENDDRVQDPYCIRCQPQVAGACIDLLRNVATCLQTEANAATDNPLIFADGTIVSGGNFHAEPVAFAADQIALAIAEVGSITQRRIALMVDPALNFGLPPFLSPKPGLNSGFMIAEVTSAALMSENKQRANPCSVDSTPTSANQEDHVSMACHAAYRLLQMNRNLTQIIAIELMAAVQGVEFRAPLKTSTPLQKVIALLREQIPALTHDRYMAGDIEKAAGLVCGDGLFAVAGDEYLPALTV